MTDATWHVPPTLLRRFVDAPGGLDDVSASSIEAHLVECGACRTRLRDWADREALAFSWDAVADRIDRPRVTMGERVLQRLGVQGNAARLLAATPALRAASLVAVVVIAAAAAVASRSADAGGPFLLLAPLAPLVMVGVSFAPTGDPAAEAGLATPLHGAGLVLRRAFAVLVVTFAALGLATPAVPGLGIEAAGWVVPALALTLGSMCAATWVRAEVAVAVLASVWLIAVPVLRWSAGREVAYAASPAFTAAGQLTAAAVAFLAAAVLVARRDHFATLGVLR